MRKNSLRVIGPSASTRSTLLAPGVELFGDLADRAGVPPLEGVAAELACVETLFLGVTREGGPRDLRGLGRIDFRALGRIDFRGLVTMDLRGLEVASTGEDAGTPNTPSPILVAGDGLGFLPDPGVGSSFSSRSQGLFFPLPPDEVVEVKESRLATSPAVAMPLFLGVLSALAEAGDGAKTFRLTL
jgi:hypothetical protein